MQNAAYRSRFRVSEPACLQIDPAPMWSMLLGDLSRGLPAAIMALRFHNGLSRGAGRNDATARRARRRRDSPFDTVALSGGCFQNRILFESVAAELRAAGFVVLTARRGSGQ